MAWFRDDPIVLLGMHRSGTTMLARMLEGLGVFMGRRLEENHEAVAFLEANDDLLSRAHAAWDRPTGISELIAHDDAAAAATESMRSRLRTLSFRRAYLGTAGLARGLDDGPWGWKDPRTSVTWPLWAPLFPAAKRVVVRRHGVDVAASLWRRARKQLDDQPDRYAGDAHLARFASVRCLELDRAFALWAEYEEALDAVADGALEVVYEELLAAPERELGRVIAHLGLDAAPESIAAAAGSADASRALAHRADPELLAFAEENVSHPRLARWAPDGT